MVVGIVLTVGLIISVLSFYLLMLSIYLLLQKNTKKLENLLMIGFSPAAVAAVRISTHGGAECSGGGHGGAAGVDGT